MVADAQSGTGTLKLRVLSPLGSVVDAEVRSVMLPGLEGDFTVLTEHHETVAQLRPGVGMYTSAGEEHLMSLFGGVATVHNDEITVVSPVCEAAEAIDVARAQEARERAKERLARKDDETIDVERAQAALQRALLRLHATELSGRK